MLLNALFQLVSSFWDKVGLTVLSPHWGYLCLPVPGPSDQSPYNLPLSSGFLRPFNRVNLIFLMKPQSNVGSLRTPYHTTIWRKHSFICFLSRMDTHQSAALRASISVPDPPLPPAGAPPGHAPQAGLLNCTHSHQAGDSWGGGGFPGHCYPPTPVRSPRRHGQM